MLHCGVSNIKNIFLPNFGQKSCYQTNLNLSKFYLFWLCNLSSPNSSFQKKEKRKEPKKRTTEPNWAKAHLSSLSLSSLTGRPHPSAATSRTRSCSPRTPMRRTLSPSRGPKPRRPCPTLPPIKLRPSTTAPISANPSRRKTLAGPRGKILSAAAAGHAPVSYRGREETPKTTPSAPRSSRGRTASPAPFPSRLTPSSDFWRGRRRAPAKSPAKPIEVVLFSLSTNRCSV